MHTDRNALHVSSVCICGSNIVCRQLTSDLTPSAGPGGPQPSSMISAGQSGEQPSSDLRAAGQRFLTEITEIKATEDLGEGQKEWRFARSAIVVASPWPRWL
jgi:hypothetical protein